jgi:peptide/nickel transport system substrate-binding protein
MSALTSRGGLGHARKAPAVLSVVVLVLAGCGGTQTSPSQAGGSSAAASRQSITIALPAEPTSLASWEAYGQVTHPVLRNVEEALLNRDPVTNELVGELATSWNQVDPTTWQFELREGVHFHDGSPFNAEAAAFALNHTWSKENGFAIRDYIGPEITASAAGEYVLDVKTQTPDPILPTRLYLSPIFSMKAFQENPESYSTTPVGTGPYRFVEWVRGQHIDLEANPDWWGNESPDAGGKISIPRARFIFREEPDVRLSALQADEAQFARWLPKEQCDQAPQCVGGPGVETIWIRPDIPFPLFQDRRIRLAISLAIDKNAIMNSIVGGGTPAAMTVGPSALGLDPNLQPYPYDPKQAADLVKQAAADGVPTDAQIRLIYNPEYVVHASEIAEVVAQELTEIGLQARIEVQETAQYDETWVVHPVPLDRGMLGLDQHSEELMDLAPTAQSEFTCDSPNSTFCDRKLDSLVKTAVPLTGDEREAALQAVAKYAYEQIYVIPIGQPNLYFGLSEDLNWQVRLDGLILLKEMSFR